MKQNIRLFLVVVISITMLSGCGLLNDLTGKADTVVFYGEEEKVQDIIVDEQKEAKKYGQYEMKLLDQDEQKIMVLEQKTAKTLLEDDLWRQVNDKNKTDKLKKLPEMSENQVILFGKEKIEELNIGEQKLDVLYGGHTIIGQGRSYIDLFLIVPDEIYHTMQSKEQSIGYLHYATNPSKKMKDMDAEYIQLLRMK